MQTYDSVARRYSDAFQRIESRIFEWPWLLRRIEERNPENVVDLGCGNGYLSQALSARGYRMTAIDPSEKMLAHARLSPDVRAIRGSGERIPLEDRSADMIVSFLSFRYMDWPKALAEMHRVLRPEGTVIIVDMLASKAGLRAMPLMMKTLIRSRVQHMTDRRYAKALKDLHASANWRHLVRNNPRRTVEDCRAAIASRFAIVEERRLSQSLRACTVGYVCRRSTPGIEHG